MSASIFSLLWGSTALLVVVAGDQGSCGPPTRLYFAELMDEYKDKTSFPVGSIVKYKCRPGYFSFKTSLKSLKCLESLEWSQAPKFCKEKSCGNPGEPANGRLIVPKDLHFGSTVNFICDEGHRLIGRSSIRCMIFAQKVDWSGEIPLCQRIPCYPPPDIPHGKHDGGYDRDYHYGDAVTYTCDRDYPLVGKRFIHCTTKDGVNGVWSGHPACGVTPCPAPQIENGSIVDGHSGTYTHKHKVTLDCGAGHILTGSREISCQADGTWDPPVPLCEQAIQCSIPQRITNGKYNSQSSEVFTEGAFVEYSCEPGYKLIGEARLYCTKSGSWSFPAPYCEVMGCVGLEIQNGRITSSKVLFKPGEIITFECDPDFDLLGNQVIQCQSDSTWDSPVPTCVNGSCGPPTSLKLAELANEYKNKNSFPVGSAVKYMCRPGYAGLRTSVTCLSNLTWSNIDEFCRKKSCGNPGEPENGRLIVPEDLLFGSTVNFTCDEGHRLIGQSFIRCVLSGQKVIWSGKIPFCQRIRCYPPPDIPHGKYKYNSKSNQDYYYGDALSYTCEKGYPRVGEDFIHCTTTKDGKNGMWSGQAICGVTPCPAPQVENGGIVAGDSGTYTYKHKVTLGCRAGHVLTGSREIYCQADGTWDPPVPLCEWVSQCPIPPNIANGNHNATAGEIFTSHMSVTYFCDLGYSLVGKASISCTPSGDWSLPRPHCEVQCSTPQRITNGKHNSQDSDVFTKGASVEYSCEPGYHLIGEATINCTEFGSWSSHPPYCEVVQCPSPPKVLHGKYGALASTTFTNGKSIKYSCEPGYVLIGEAIVYCTASGTWSPPVPQCEVKGCEGPEIKNGRKSSTKRLFKPMEKITFECDHGYILKGNTTIQCQSDSTWDFPVPLCVRVLQCTPPPSISNGEHDGHGLANFPVGTHVNYTCNPGYFLVGEASSHCTSSGGWSQPVPQCEVMRCPLPPRISHGSYFGENVTYQMSVIYVCDAGYSLVGDPMVICTSQGSDSANWSEPPKCKGCLAPQKIANGKPDTEVLEDFAYGSSVTYHCDPGYFLTGAATIYCLSSGMWDPSVPHCEVQGCEGPEIKNGRKSSSNLLFKPTEKITFECDHGYILKGDATIECKSDSTWDFPVPLCVRGNITAKIPLTLRSPFVSQCPFPPHIDNGYHIGEAASVFPAGTTVNYSCISGYILIGQESISCTESGAWNLPPPRCEVLQCTPPPSISNGEHDGHGLANIPAGTCVNYTCNPGYLLVGEASSHCTSSGGWSQPVPQCKVMRCPLPPRISHGSYFGENFMYQMSVIYVCDAGYSLVGDPMVICTSQGSDSANWSEPPKCKGCLAPQKIANGKPDTEVLEDFAYGSSVTYHCEPGYFLTGAATLYCLSSGMWDPSVPHCEVQGCVCPEIQNGRKRTSELLFKPRETVTFDCAPGYILKGNNTIECQSDSTWDFPVPLCVRAIGCILPQIPGGKKTKVNNLIQSGDNVTVECEDGYVLEGSPYVQCQHDFSWDPPVPVCKPGFYLSASISLGSLVGFLLLLAISGIIWMAVSKRNKARYAPANRKEISDSSNGRI